VLKNCLIAAGIIVGAVILATALFICFNDDAREAFKEGFKEGYEETVGSEVQYLSLSPEKRDKLKADLFERLDRYFISALEDDESLMQLILLSAMGENSEVLEEAILNKMLPILEEWIEDNNIDADSFTESDSEEIGVDYVLHLLELIVSEVE
jgi:hypothetical protein